MNVIEEDITPSWVLNRGDSATMEEDGGSFDDPW